MNIIRVGYLSGGNTLMVNVESGAVVSATNGTKTVTGVSVDGLCKLRVQAGTWTVIATKGSDVSQPVDVVVTDSYSREMSFGLPLSSLAEGALVQLNESGAGVNFCLAKHDYESGLNGAGRELLVRKDCYDTRAWDSNVNAWASCSLRSWLNGDYLNMIDSAVREMIGTTAYYYTIGNGDTTVTTRSDAVFLLSVTELGKTANYANVEGTALPIASTLQIAYHNGYAVKQWTRSQNSFFTTFVCLFSTDGSVGGEICTKTYGSRPAFTLPSDAMVNPTPNADGSYTLIA